MHWRTFLILLWLTAYGLVSLTAYQGAWHAQRQGHPAIAGCVAFCCTVGAVGLIAVWWVLGRTPIAGRLSVATIAVLVLSRLLSTLLNGARIPTDRMFALALILETSEIMAVGLVMLIVRQCGLQLQSPQGGPQETSVSSQRCLQFSLAALLATVGSAAILMSGLRWAISLDSMASECILLGAAFGGLAAWAIALVLLHGFFKVRCAAAGTGIAALIGGFFSRNVNLCDFVFFGVLMLVFVAASLVVFRVCGYQLERMPKVRHNAQRELSVTCDSTDSPATPAESRL